MFSVPSSKRRSLFGKNELDFTSNDEEIKKPRMRIVINPNGTLTEIDDSLNMIPVEKQSIKMPKHGYADLTKQILGDCIKLYNKDPDFFMQTKKQK